MDVDLPEDNTLIITKKIMAARSVSKVNDETVTAGRLKEITSLLIDIHGQHEHQSLMYKSKHLQILDDYAKSRTTPIKEETALVFGQYQKLSKKRDAMNLDQEERLREADFCRYEIEELEKADLKEGEEETLTAEYRRLKHSQKIMEHLSEAYDILENAQVSAALKAVDGAAEYDEAMGDIRNQMYDADAFINDVSRHIREYMDDFSFDEEEFVRIEERLDLIHNLQAKYGSSTERILEQLEEKKKRLEELENYDLVKQETERQWRACARQSGKTVRKAVGGEEKRGGKTDKEDQPGAEGPEFYGCAVFYGI